MISRHLGNDSINRRDIRQNDAYLSLYVLLHPIGRYNFQYKMAAMLKIEKSRYLDNGLTDRHKIWYDDD